MNKNVKMIITLLVLIVVAGGAYAVLTTPEDRSFGQKIKDAANSLDEGVDDAARQLEDRSPLEKMQDGYKDATDGDAN